MRAILTLLTLLALAGCAAVQPFDYQVADQRKGPGLFSGPAGEFVLTR